MKSKQGYVNPGIIVASVLALSIAAYFILSNSNDTIEENKITKNQTQFIAVRPFLNLSKDSIEQYFSDGLTEDIRNSLAHLNGLKVIASSSSFKDTSQEINIKQEGKKLGVTTILEGTVQSQGDRLIIIAKLFNVGDGTNFWSAKYDENIDDIFALQAKIVNDIAEKLQVILSKDQQVISDKKPTKSLKAYRLFLQAHALWNRKTLRISKMRLLFFSKLSILIHLLLQPFRVWLTVILHWAMEVL